MAGEWFGVGVTPKLVLLLVCFFRCCTLLLKYF